MAVLLVVLGLLAVSAPAVASASDAAAGRGVGGGSRARSDAAFSQLPVWFEANVGQTDSAVEYLARGNGYTVFLARSEVVISLARPGSAGQGGAQAPAVTDVVRLSLVGGNQHPEIVGLDRQAGHSNYYGSADPSQWHEGVPTYGSVAYRNAYPGIDLIFHGDDGQVKFDFVVAPGTDPGVISVQVDGAGLALDGGDLEITTPGGAELRKPEPIVYQDVDGARRAVAGSYLLESDGRFGFELGSYDASRPLVIDPALSYSTALQGERPYRIVVDDRFNAYIHGETASATFPGRSTPPSAQPDVFVAKLATDGTRLQYVTFLGNRGGSPTAVHRLRVHGLAVAGDRHAYVAGETLDDTLPVVGGGTQRDPAGAPPSAVCPLACNPHYDGFLLRLGTNGQVTFGTYLQNHMRVRDIAVDPNGVYLAGTTHNPGLATTPNAVQAAPDGPIYPGGGSTGWGFVARVVPGPTNFYSYLTYFGNRVYLSAVAAGGGSAHVTGMLNWSEGNDDDAFNHYSIQHNDPDARVPRKNAYQNDRRQRQHDLFVSKIDTMVSDPAASLVYSTYLSGTGTGPASTCPAPTADTCQGAYDIAVHEGLMYVTGYSGSFDFPTTLLTALERFNPGGLTGFVAQIDPGRSGTASLLYSTFLGGAQADRAFGIAVASPAAVTVTGWTMSDSFPISDPLAGQGAYRPGAADGFVTTLDLTKVGSAGLLRSTFLGGTGADKGRSVVLDANGDLYLRGSTTSGDFPTTPGAFPQGGSGGFVAKVGSAVPEPCPALTPSSTPRLMAKAGPGAASAGVLGFGLLDGGLGLPAWVTAASQRRRRRQSAPSPAGCPEPPRRRRGHGGFTLVELLVVVVILGVLAAVVVFAVRGSDGQGRRAAAQTDERIIRTALEAYCAQKGHYPIDPPPDPVTGVDKDALDTLVEEKFLGSRSGYNNLVTGNAEPEGNCPGNGPRHYNLIGTPPATTPTTAPTTTPTTVNPNCP